MAVETLKRISLDKTKLSETAPEKVTNETGHSGDVYRVTLNNLSLHFNDETLTKALAKLSLPNSVGANVVFDSESKEDPLVEVKLKALLNDLFESV